VLIRRRASSWLEVSGGMVGGRHSAPGAAD
jgi:hypothetical protein